MGIVGNLTPEQRQSFDYQGLIVIESFASPEEIEAMRKRMDELLQDFDPTATASIFSTQNQLKLTNEYFYESAEMISFFFEEKAFHDNGNLKQSLHEIDRVFREFSYSKKVSSLLFSLGYKRPVVIQSMYIFKMVLLEGSLEVKMEFNLIIPHHHLTRKILCLLN